MSEQQQQQQQQRPRPSRVYRTAVRTLWADGAAANGRTHACLKPGDQTHNPQNARIHKRTHPQTCF
jgi:hypothetical protein